VIAVDALHVSGGFSAHHQELKFQNCTHSIWYVLSLFAAAASVGESELGVRGGVVVKALCYKPAGRGFDSRWCHWNFSVT
jgi:hypothetical protein